MAERGGGPRDDHLDGVSYRGLPVRDSLLVLATALGLASDAIESASPDSAGHLLHRAYAVLREVAVRYAGDPEVWYELAELAHHNGPSLGVTWDEEGAALGRAIALDPGFLPSYFHAPEWALRRGDLALARRYARAFIALDPSGVHQDPEAVGTRLAATLLDPARAASPEIA